MATRQRRSDSAGKKRQCGDVLWIINEKSECCARAKFWTSPCTKSWIRPCMGSSRSIMLTLQDKVSLVEVHVATLEEQKITICTDNRLGISYSIFWAISSVTNWHCTGYQDWQIFSKWLLLNWLLHKRKINFQLWDWKTLPVWLNASLLKTEAFSWNWQCFPISKLVSENSPFGRYLLPIISNNIG